MKNVKYLKYFIKFYVQKFNKTILFPKKYSISELGLIRIKLTI